MAISDKSQIASPVAVTFSTLPSRYPEIPPDVIKRFPSFKSWQDDVQRMHARISEALESINEDLSAPINELTQKSNEILSVVEGTLSAQINIERIARIDGDTALAATIATIVAAAGTSNTVFVQTSAPTANSVNDLWFDSDDGFKEYYWSGTAWVEVTDSRLSATIAAVSVETVARSTADSAMAAQITSLLSTTGGLTSSVSVILSTYATTTYADAKKSEAITAAAADAASRVATEASARASADSALATRTGTLESQVQTPTTGLLARVSTVESTYATTSSVGASISTVTAAFTLADSTIQANLNRKISVQGSAPSTPAVGDLWIDTGDSNKSKFWDGSAWIYKQDGVLFAAITTETSSRVTADSAMASSISTLTASVSGLSASVSAEASARAAADGNLASKYTLKVIAGNVVTGMNISSSSSGGVDLSDVTFSTGSFKVTNSNGTITPFDIRSGGVIVFGGDCMSDNFVTGVSGWRINRNTGDAEFHNATVRGTLFAADIVGTLTVGQLPPGIGPTVSGTVNGSSNVNLTGSNTPTTLQTTVTVGTLINIFLSGIFTNNGSTTSTFAVLLYIDGSYSGISVAIGSLGSGGSLPFTLFRTISIAAGSHTFQLYATGFPENVTVGATLTIQ